MNGVPTDIWQYQARLGQRLLAWSGLNVAAGVAMSLARDRWWAGVGTQALSWGLVNGVIGWLGLHGARRRSRTTAAHSPAAQRERATVLRRVLWINTGLDPVYMAGGIAVALTKGRSDRFWRGTGWGIVAQGAFLLLFDLTHALLLNPARKEVH